MPGLSPGLRPLGFLAGGAAGAAAERGATLGKYLCWILGVRSTRSRGPDHGVELPGLPTFPVLQYEHRGRGSLDQDERPYLQGTSFIRRRARWLAKVKTITLSE